MHVLIERIPNFSEGIPGEITKPPTEEPLLLGHLQASQGAPTAQLPSERSGLATAPLETVLLPAVLSQVDVSM